MPVKQNRLVCGTAYDVTEFTKLDPRVQYLAWGEEVCPDTGRAHLQFFSYGAKMSFKAWQEIYKPHHVEFCKGSIYDQYAYTMKEGKWHELGDRPMIAGTKRVMHSIKAELDAGERPTKLMKKEEYFGTFAQHDKFFTKYHNVVTMDKLREQGYKQREVYILIGASGSGKSKYVYEHHSSVDVYIMPRRDAKWCGSYSGQSVVVYNDVRCGDVMSIPDFLNITDGYPIEVESKGGFVPWEAQVIYITSNDPIERWWPTSSPSDLAAVRRRITAVITI